MRYALFIIASDPRTSGRPAEAVRIAAGIASSRQIEVRVYLRGPAALALSEGAEEFVDGEYFSRYLPLVVEAGQKIYVQRTATAVSKLGEMPMPHELIEEGQLAALAADSQFVLHF